MSHADDARDANDHFADILRFARHLPPIRVCVVHPTSTLALEAAAQATAAGLISPILVGPAQRIQLAAVTAKIDISGWPLIDTDHSHAAAAQAVAITARGDADALMKGALHTDELLHAVIAKGSGLTTESRVSHAYILDIPAYHKPLIITDAAVNIAPGLDEKADICRNAIDLWRSIFDEARKPKVAVLSAVETVMSAMPSTIDAAALCKMADRGQISGAIVDGPLAFDNIIDREAANEKGLFSPVAGDADIIVVPNIETGNALAKELIYLGHAQAAGIVLGARVPIILTSRADTVRTRLLSCVAAQFVFNARQKGLIK